MADQRTRELAFLLGRTGDDSPEIEKQVFRLWAAARAVLKSLDSIYPAGGKNLPGVTLYSAMERLRHALPDEIVEPDRG